jgi:hypothetical protein
MPAPPTGGEPVPHELFPDKTARCILVPEAPLFFPKQGRIFQSLRYPFQSESRVGTGTFRWLWGAAPQRRPAAGFPQVKACRPARPLRDRAE